MHFIVLGVGAIGSYVGARLAAGGRRVTLVGRRRRIEQLALTGLVASDLDGARVQVPAARFQLASALTEVSLGAQDVLLLCVKGPATEAAALEIAACCPSGLTIVSLQNGVDNVARITAIAPAMRVLAGMVPFNVVMPEFHHAHRATSGRIHLQQHSIAREMALLMDACGLPVTLAADMRSVQWGKLLLNLNNPVNALSGMPLRAQLMDRDYRRVLAALQREALRVLQRSGIRPARVSLVPAALMPRLLELPNPLFRLLAAGMLRIDASARSSMWDDIQRGRPTEVDDLCGAVVRLGTRHGVPTPRNEAMCRLIASHHQGQQSFSGRALRAAEFS